MRVPGENHNINTVWFITPLMVMKMMRFYNTEIEHMEYICDKRVSDPLPKNALILYDVHTLSAL